MDIIKVMIADDHEETRELIRKILLIQDDIEVVTDASDGIEAIQKYESEEIDVILMDINMPEMNGLEAADKLSSEYPDVTIVMMSVQNESEYLRKAMDSGARSYIVKPFDVDALSETIRSAYNKNRPKRANLSDINRSEGKIFSFYGSKGGVGKSVLAMNGSVILSSRTGVRTILVDLDLQFGDVGMLMNIKPRVTLNDALQPGAEDIYEQIESAIMKQSDQLDVLLAPKRPDQAEGIEASDIKTLLNWLKTKYDYVMVDLGTNYSEVTLSALDLSDEIFFVSTPDMLSIKNTRLGLDVMRSLDYDFDKVNLVLNRWTGKEKIKDADISRALGVEISAKVSDERKHMLEMINRGDPIAAEKRMKGSKFMKDMLKLMRKID